MRGPPYAFNQIRVSLGSRHGLPWAFLCCYTQGSFCMPSISEAPIPVVLQDACCLFDVKAFSHLFQTEPHKKMMWLESISVVQNRPPSCLILYMIAWRVNHCLYIMLSSRMLCSSADLFRYVWCLLCCTYCFQSIWENSSHSSSKLHQGKSQGAYIWQYSIHLKLWEINSLRCDTWREKISLYSELMKHFWLYTPGYINWKQVCYRCKSSEGKKRMICSVVVVVVESYIPLSNSYLWLW